VFERYTESARRAIFLSMETALRHNAQEISTRDLILGSVRENHPEPSPLHGLRGKAEELAAAFGYTWSQTGPSQSGASQFEPSQHREVPLTNASKRALAYAAEEAGSDGRYSIDVEHLVRGVLREDRSAKRILARFGYTLKSLRVASKEAHTTVPDGTPNSGNGRSTVTVRHVHHARPRPFGRRHLVLLATALAVAIILGIVYVLE